MRFLTRTMTRTLIGTVAALAAVVAMTPAATAAGHAYDDPCRSGGSFVCQTLETGMQDNPNDDGGMDASVHILQTTAGGKYTAWFTAYDEVVWVTDDSSDGHKARVDLIYYGPGGPYYYHYSTGDTRKIQLGKDGDLTENKVIAIRVCIEHHGCTSYAKGIT